MHTGLLGGGVARAEAKIAGVIADVGAAYHTSVGNGRAATDGNVVPGNDLRATNASI
jgi:hypothetical protein